MLLRASGLIGILQLALPAWSQTADESGTPAATAAPSTAGEGIYLGPGSSQGFQARDPISGMPTSPRGDVLLRDPVSGLPLSPGGTGLPFLGGTAELPQYQGDYNVFDVTGGGTAGGGVLEPGYTVTPSVMLRVSGTTNARTLPNGETQSDIVPSITPAVRATGNTAYIYGFANYAPTFRYSTFDPKSSSIYQIFTMSGRVTLMPERVFMNVLAFGNISDVYGGYAPAASSAITGTTNSRNVVQTIGGQVAPTAVHHFGDLATGQIGYTYRYSQQTGSSAYLQGSTTPFFKSNESSANTAYGILRTGPASGRIAMQLYGVGTTIGGTGAAAGATIARASFETRYAVERDFWVSGEIGYDDQRYEGTTPFTIEKPLWSVGFRATPDPDSYIIFRYGQRNGYLSPYLLANTLLGSRTRLTASYTDRIGTTALTTIDLLSATGVDELGNAYDKLAGAPILPVPFINSFFGTQSSVQRIKRALLNLNQGWDRNNFSIFLNYTDSTPLTSQPGTVGFTQKGYYVGGSWGHRLSPTLSSTLTGSYGMTDSTPVGATTSAPSSGGTFSVRAALTETFSPTLTGTLNYIFSTRANTVSSPQSTQNIFIATLRKTF